MKLIIRWIIISVAVLASTKIIGSGISANPIWVVLIVGALLTLINMFIKPIIKILTLPLTIITLGLFSLVVNGAIFWYLGSGIINGFEVKGFYAAIIGSIIVSIINWLITKILRVDD
jgi:putative membrane protein